MPRSPGRTALGVPLDRKVGSCCCLRPEGRSLGRIALGVPIGVLLLERSGDEATALELRAMLARRGLTFVRRMGSRRRNDLFVGAELLPSVADVVAREQLEPGGARRVRGPQKES